VAVSTFRRSGDAVVTPCWITQLDGDKVGFWTSSASAKVERLRNNPAVTLQACDQRAKVRAGSPVVSGRQAAVVSSGAEFDRIQTQIRSKYGFMVPASRLFNRLGHLGKTFPYGISVWSSRWIRGLWVRSGWGPGGLSGGPGVGSGAGRVVSLSARW
jgi:PPOX class probable F420-dependent enzyme